MSWRPNVTCAWSVANRKGQPKSAHQCMSTECIDNQKLCYRKKREAQRRKAQQAEYRKFPGNDLQQARQALIHAAWESVDRHAGVDAKWAAAKPFRLAEGVCRWCETDILKPKDGTRDKRRSWHDGRGSENDCLREYFCHTRSDQQLAYLIEQSGPVCACCRGVFGEWTCRGEVNPERRRSYSSSWAKLYPPEIYVGIFSEVHFRTALQVDHRLALGVVVRTIPEADRWRYWGPMNLQLLCHECHSRKTKNDTAQIRALKAADNDNHPKNEESAA